MVRSRTNHTALFPFNLQSMAIRATDSWLLPLTNRRELRTFSPLGVPRGNKHAALPSHEREFGLDLDPHPILPLPTPPHPKPLPCPFPARPQLSQTLPPTHHQPTGTCRAVTFRGKRKGFGVMAGVIEACTPAGHATARFGLRDVCFSAEHPFIRSPPRKTHNHV